MVSVGNFSVGMRFLPVGGALEKLEFSFLHDTKFFSEEEEEEEETLKIQFSLIPWRRLAQSSQP